MRLPSAPRLGSATWLALAAALCLPVLGFWQSLHTHDTLLVDAEQNTLVLSHSLAQHAARTLEAVDIMLTDVVEQVDNPYGRDLKTYLDQRAALLNQVRFLDVVNAAGDIVADSTTTHAKINIAERQHYLWHRDHTDSDLFIGDPQASKLINGMVFTMSRRITDQNGAFAGLAVAALPPSYFQQFYQSLEHGTHGALGLWRDTGHLMARYPQVLDKAGRDITTQAVRTLPTEKLTTVREVSPTDGIDRIVTFEHLDGFPMVVTAALAVDDVLAPWRHDLLDGGLALGCGSLALTVLAFGLERQRRAASRSAAATREADRRYRVLADTTSDLIVQVSLDLRRDYVSPACRKLVGHDPEEMIGRDPQGHMHPDDAPDVMVKLRALVNGTAPGDTNRATYRIRHKDGHWVWVDAVANLVRDPDTGVPSTVISSLRDVTERQRVSRHLEQAKVVAENVARQQSEFMANMSHELRTPLTGILGIHDLLQRDPHLGPEQRRLLVMAHDAGRSLLSIVNDVLDFSKIEAGQLAIEQVRFRMDELVDSCAEFAGELAKPKGLRLATTLANADRMLLGDPARLRQVLLNLTTNALKFTSDGSVTIQGSYRVDTSRMRIEVVDTGIGIPADKLPALFARFSQADASTTRRFGGTGLGLAICKRLVELMGGQIGVTSVVGEGSTFWFEVPLQAALADADQPAPLGVEISMPASYRVLLAEDNVVNQEVIAAMLKHRGHEVTVVDNGAAAAAAVQARPGFELVLMDIQMPVMDGLTATRMIREAEAANGQAAVPIIGLTANALKEDVARCLAVGMMAHVAKPIDWAELFTTIERVVSVDVARKHHSPIAAPISSAVPRAA